MSDSWHPMSASAALEALHAAVLEGDGIRIAKYTEAAIRGGASRAAIRSVVHRARRESASDQPAVTLALADPMRWIANVTDAFLLEEVDGSVAPLSSAAQRVIGVGFHGDLARAIARIVGADPAPPEVDELLRRARDRGEAADVISDPTGRDSGWQLLASKTAEQRVRVFLRRTAGAATAALEQRAERADVLAAINHEMTNAMTAVATTAAKARRMAADAAGIEEALRAIEATAQGSLDAVHSARRALRGGAEVEKPEVRDLGPVVSDLVQALRPMAERQGLTLRTRIAPQLDGRVAISDLRSIVWNLLKNAIEATAEGGTIQVGASVTSDSLRVVVADDGHGMDEGTLSRAFEAYFSTKETGMGLGLPMVRELVEKLDGELMVESKPGRGTRVAVRLPRALPKITREEPPSGLRRRGPLLDTRILLVTTGLRVPARALEVQGAVVVQRLHVHEVADVGGTFDVAVIDALLDGGAGLGFARELRSRGDAKRVILISGRLDGEEVDGVDVVLPRGFGFAELMDTLQPSPEEGQQAQDLRPRRKRKASS